MKKTEFFSDFEGDLEEKEEKEKKNEYIEVELEDTKWKLSKSQESLKEGREKIHQLNA